MVDGPPAPAGPREELLEKVVTWLVENGVGDTSLRTLAEAVGSSHRMLLYHFGSREDLLAAVIMRIAGSEQAAATGFSAGDADPFAAGWDLWRRIADDHRVAALTFELASHAMLGRPYAAPLRQALVDDWVSATEVGYRHIASPERARRLAWLGVAVVRGVVFDLALTGDRENADATMAEYARLVGLATGGDT